MLGFSRTSFSTTTRQSSSPQHGKTESFHNNQPSLNCFSAQLSGGSMPSSEAICTALNEKLQEAGLKGNFKYNDEYYSVTITTTYTDTEPARNEIIEKLSDLFAVLQIEDEDLLVSMKGSSTAYMLISINADKLQQLFEHPLPIVQDLLKLAPKTSIVKALNRKLREMDLEGTFKYDGEYYSVTINTNHTDYESANDEVREKLSDLAAVLQIKNTGSIFTSGKFSSTDFCATIIKINANKLQELIENPLPTAAQFLKFAAKPSVQEKISYYKGYFKELEGNTFIETNNIDEAKAIATKLSQSPFNIAGGDGRSPKWPGPHKYGTNKKFGVVITPQNLAGRKIEDFIKDLNI